MATRTPEELIKGLKAFALELVAYQDTYQAECALVHDAANALTEARAEIIRLEQSVGQAHEEQFIRADKTEAIISTPEELTDTIRGWAEDIGLRPDATAEGRFVYAIVRARLLACAAALTDALAERDAYQRGAQEWNEKFNEWTAPYAARAEAAEAERDRIRAALNDLWTWATEARTHLTTDPVPDGLGAQVIAALSGDDSGQED